MSERITESVMQAVLMRWAMRELNHKLVVPNSTMIFYWEADLISVTKSDYAHEYEIKVSMADYKRDAQKAEKHNQLIFYKKNIPNYFWYATTFDIVPPDHAGWVKVSWDEQQKYYRVSIMKPAPRLSSEKLSERKMADIGRLLSFRVTNLYASYLFRPEMESVISGSMLTAEQNLALAEVEA